MENLIEIHWYGRSEQGAMTASKLLATSALTEGKYIQAFPEYGSEENEHIIKEIQEEIDRNWEKLLVKCDKGRKQ